MHEKRGIIESGRTNPEEEQQKTASEDQLDDDVTKRAADAVADSLGEEAESQ